MSTDGLGKHRSTLPLPAPYHRGQGAQDQAFFELMNQTDWPEAMAMVAAGQDPTVVMGEYRMTTLHHLAFMRFMPEAMWRTVLDWGLPVTPTDSTGETPAQMLLGTLRSGRPSHSRPWFVAQDMTEGLLQALIDRGATHGIADSLNHHVPLVLHAAQGTDDHVGERLDLAFRHLPAHEHARGWAWAFWASALNGDDGRPVYRWLMDHPPVWEQVNWNEVPYEHLGPAVQHTFRTGRPSERHLTALALLTGPSMRERFDEVMGHMGGGKGAPVASDALHQVFHHWMTARSGGDRRECARQARVLLRAGASIHAGVRQASGEWSNDIDTWCTTSPAFQRLITALEPLERQATERALRREIRGLRDDTDRPVRPVARTRPRL